MSTAEMDSLDLARPDFLRRGAALRPIRIAGGAGFDDSFSELLARRGPTMAAFHFAQVGIFRWQLQNKLQQLRCLV
jgi:hypothetical protein